VDENERHFPSGLHDFKQIAMVLCFNVKDAVVTDIVILFPCNFQFDQCPFKSDP
jgi:hypothetical protein